MADPLPVSAPYDMRCPIARTLDIIGERWTILILRDLVVGGPRKFQDFERSLAGISPNTLSARLKRLEDAGIIERRFYEQHPPRAEYVLTEKGKDLRPVLRALLDWGQHHTKYRATAKPCALFGCMATERSIFGRAAASCPSSDSAIA
jgi:DNA-binding HxlR family transcriptional regulator